MARDICKECNEKRIVECPVCWVCYGCCSCSPEERESDQFYDWESEDSPLNNLCDKTSNYEDKEQNIFYREPHQLQYQNHIWGVACNGYLMAMIRGVNEFIPINNYGKKRILQILSSPTIELGTVPIDRIKQWAGEPLFAVKCADCGGAGCNWCDYTGKLDLANGRDGDRKIFGNIGKYFFNKIWIARLLTAVPVKEETLQIIQGKDFIGLFCDGFIGILMRMNYSPEEIPTQEFLIID